MAIVPVAGIRQRKKERSMKSSWKTTLCGVLTLIAAAITMIVLPLIDNDSLTVPNYTGFGALVLPALGLFFARDNNVSSEQVGIK
jgi:hypothetical protein